MFLIAENLISLYRQVYNPQAVFDKPSAEALTGQSPKARR